MKGKKGNAGVMWGLVATVIAFVVLVIATSLTAGVVNDIQADQTANSYAANVSIAGLEGIENLSGQFSNIGTIVAVGAIIAILIAAFAYVRMR